MKHKFLEESGMFFQEVFEFADKDFAQVTKYFAEEIGQDNLIESPGFRPRSGHSTVIAAKHQPGLAPDER